ncbi:PAS domain-containing sensor histidine kinase [Methyloversatilis thermotolerans]|uniref:PAS domain-containing sensor histidine kinase n=1 Tax=Methyloversatilis thermotolerans TaxID=1346290 RepID=UPI0003617B6F|nr:histidine kinase dimerization/phospho-acceptor domain-containing protein [Methyloversatilis thermotolerans]
MNRSLPAFARRLLRHWLGVLLLAIVLLLLAVDPLGLFGETLRARSAAQGASLFWVPLLLVCVALAVTGARLDHARAVLAVARADLERAQDLGRIGAWTHSSDVFHWSERALDILGLPKERVVTLEGLLAHVDAADRDALRRAWRTARAGARHRAEFSLRVAHDETRRLLFEGRLEPGPGSTVISGIVQDMSERFRMEGELRRAMRYQRALLDNFPFMVWLKDRDLKMLAINKPLADAAGLSHPDDASGLADEDLWPAELARAYRAEDVEVMHGRHPAPCERVVDDAAGRKWLESWSAPVYDEDGGLLGLVGYAQDIGARKQAEAAVAASRDRFAALGCLQARFIAGDPPDEVHADVLRLLYEVSGAHEGFLGACRSDGSATLHVDLLACGNTDWLACRADLLDRALSVTHACTGDLLVAAPDSEAGPGLLCIAAASGGRLIGLIGLAAPSGQLDQDGMEAARVVAQTFALLLEAGQREQARRHAERELTRHRDRLSEMVEEQVAASLEAQHAAERANSAKSEFLARVSHELRTPIHAIQGFARIALRDRPPLCDTTRHRFKVILESGERLLAQVDGLLDLSRLQAGTLPLTRSRFDLADKMREIVLDRRGQAAECRVAVSLTQMPSESVIEADPYRLEGLLTALLDNAIRVTPADGEVNIHLAAAARGGLQGVCLRICDQGPAVADADFEHLFDAFEQISARRGLLAANGLQMAVCRELMKALAGQVRGYGAAGGGLCIELWLPLARRAITGSADEPRTPS